MLYVLPSRRVQLISSVIPITVLSKPYVHAGRVRPSMAINMSIDVYVTQGTHDDSDLHARVHICQNRCLWYKHIGLHGSSYSLGCTQLLPPETNAISKHMPGVYIIRLDTAIHHVEVVLD